MSRWVLWAGLILVAVALFWSLAIGLRAYPEVGSLGGRGDWFWVVAETIRQTFWLWLVGIPLVVVGTVLRLLSRG